MASLLKELLHDAERRADEIVKGLQRLAGRIANEVETYRQNMQRRVEQAGSLASSMLADPNLDNPLLASNYYRDYKYVAWLLHEVENVPLVVLRRFGLDDRKLTMLLRGIGAEINLPFDAPICSAISSQFYWTMPDMDVVFAPCLEAEHLIGIPDLYHELGHILLFREERQLVFPAMVIVDRHFDALVAEGKKQNWSEASLREVEGFHHAWRRSWLLEFGADLIATYLVGPAFGWCNIRTSTNVGGELFAGNGTHPADDARARAVGLLLDQMGFSVQAGEIRTRWDELVGLSKESAPLRYDLAYPPDLLQNVADFYMRQCNALGLKPYSPDNGDSIARAINQAWSEFRGNPDTFGQYEQALLANVLQKVGVPLTMT